MPWFRPYPVLERVIVNTRTEKAFRGLVWRLRRRYLVLREVEMIRPGGETVPVEGEMLIERANVDFIQVVT